MSDFSGNGVKGIVTGPTKAINQSGLTLNYGSITDEFFIDYPSVLPKMSGSIYSFFVEFTWNDQDTHGTVFFGTNTGTASWFQIKPSADEVIIGGTLMVSVGLPTLLDSKRHTAGFISDGSSIFMVIDGVLLKSMALPGNSMSAGAKNFKLGLWIGGSLWTHDGSISTYYFWSRAVPVPTMRLLHFDSVAPLRPADRPIAFVSAAPPAVANPWYYYAQQAQLAGRV